MRSGSVRRAERRAAALLEEASRARVFPEAPDLAARVRARIEAGPVPVAELRLPRTRWAPARPLAVAAAVVLLALGLTLSLSVTARRAVADLLGVVGIHITFDDEAAPGAPPSERLRLGSRVPLSIAERRAGFDVRIPSTRVTGARSRAVYYDPDLGATGMVSLVYPADAETAAEADLLVTQFAASVDGAFFKKVALAGGDVTYAEIASARGYWVGGEHLFYYVDAESRTREETVRLAGKVLLWESGGVTYRVEGRGSLRAALRVARSLH